MGSEQYGERNGDPNGLVVRRGSTSLEAHGRSAILVLCTILIIAAIVWQGREIQRTIQNHESQYERGIEAARSMIIQFGQQRQIEHQAIMRRIDIASCAALLTETERKWVRDNRHVTWDDRCPWITPEPRQDDARPIR
jgi:hypothetical protein